MKETKISPVACALSRLFECSASHGRKIIVFFFTCFSRLQKAIDRSNGVVIVSVFASAGILRAALAFAASAPRKAREEAVWKAFASRELHEGRREAHHHSPRKINSDQKENLCNLIDLARELGIDPRDREYREVCYLLAHDALPDEFLVLPEEDVGKRKNCPNGPLKKLRILAAYIFRGPPEKEDARDDWSTLVALSKYPEILTAVKSEFRANLERKMCVTAAQRSFHFFEYFAFHSCARTLVYVLVLQLSAVSVLSQTSIGAISRKKANLWLFSFLYGAFAEKRTDVMGALGKLANALAAVNLRSVCATAGNFFFTDFRRRLLARISAAHRKRQARKFHQTLKSVSTAYLDAHTVDDIEGLYYYIHDLEGVELQMQMALTRCWDGLCYLWGLQYRIGCTLPVLVASWGASCVIDGLFRDVTSYFEKLSGARLKQLELEISRTKNAFGSHAMHRAHEDGAILFHQPLYVAVISHLKTFRMMGLDRALLDQHEAGNGISANTEGLFSTVSGLLADSCDQSGTKLSSTNAVPLMCTHFRDLLMEKAMCFWEKFLDVANVTAQMIIFLAWAAPSIVLGEETTYFLKCLESFECYQTSREHLAQWKNIVELLETNTGRASALNAFYAEENIAKPNPPSFVTEKPELIGKGFIDFRDMSFKYADARTPILRGVSLRIPLGCFCVIRGPNGCGKSTLLSILARLYTLDRGDIRVVLHEKRTASPHGAARRKRWRNIASFLPQEHALLPCTLAENISCSRSNISKERLNDVCEATRLLRDVDSLACGWQTLIGCGAGKMELSQGQAQKVMLARFLLNDSPIWILDEPTNFLDAETKASLVVHFRKFLASGSTTECRTNGESDSSLIIPKSIICISHDETFISHADCCVDFPCS